MAQWTGRVNSDRGARFPTGLAPADFASVQDVDRHVGVVSDIKDNSASCPWRTSLEREENFIGTRGELHWNGCSNNVGVFSANCPRDLMKSRLPPFDRDTSYL